MSNKSPRVAQIKNVFAKAAKGELVPNNFGSCLLTAANEGLISKKRIANILDTDVSLIRKVGNNLKPRDIASVSRSIVR